MDLKHENAIMSIDSEVASGTGDTPGTNIQYLVYFLPNLKDIVQQQTQINELKHRPRNQTPKTLRILEKPNLL